MSYRENIASNIITVLDAMTSPVELKKITREPFQPDEISEQQFPAVYISSGDEERNDVTIGDSSIKREGRIDYVVVGYVKGTDTNIDTKRNQLIEAIEEALDADRTRNGNALDTQVIAVSSDEGTIFPYGGINMTVRVTYQFTRGNT